MTDDERDRLFLVVRNSQEQYSIWPEDLRVPEGWSVIGPPRGKFECLAYIDSVWTDMRPRSLRPAATHQG
jgi:MbtH protein